MNETELTMRFKVADDGSVTLDKIGKNIQGIEQHTEKMNRSLNLIKLDSLINLGERAFRAGEQVYGMVKRVAEATDEIGRNAKIAGLSTDTYQKLAYAAKMSDVDIGELSKGMKILAGHMDDVRKGSEQATSLFQSLAVSTVDASGKTKSFEVMLGDLADRFKAMPDGVNKMALATDLFGRSGERLIPFLNEGKAGLKAFSEEAEKLGIVLDEKLLKSGSELENRLKRAESFFTSLWNRVIIGAYESIDAMQKFNKSWGVEEGRGMRETLGIEKKKPAPSMMAVIGEEVEEGPPAYLRQSEAALKAIATANEKIIEQNYRLSDLYDYEANVLKGQGKLLEDREKAMSLVDKLGLKTKIGAEKEIADVMEQRRLLGTLGLSPEEMGQAGTKLEEQLRAIEGKYKAESGWKAIGEEGGVRWWQNVTPKEGVGRDITEMVTKAIDELNRMQAVAEQVTGPKTLMIDYTPVQNANEMVQNLRKELEDLSRREFPITLTINQRSPSGDSIEVIEDALVTRITNKQSRLGSIIRKDMEGVTYYGNE